MVNASDRMIRVFRSDRAVCSFSPPSHSNPHSLSPSPPLSPPPLSSNDRTEGQIQEHRFQDLVDRVQWKTCSFSNGGDFVVAGSAQDGKHHIHIWDREKGSLLKILDGPREGLLDLMWHPARPIIASISTYGVVYIWGVNYTVGACACAGLSFPLLLPTPFPSPHTLSFSPHPFLGKLECLCPRFQRAGGECRVH